MAELQEQCSRKRAPTAWTCDDGGVSETRPTRAQARAHQVETIKSTSRRLMARHGAAGLSLREVAREVPVLRARVVAAEQAVSPRALAEAEKWCLLTNVPRP